MIDLDGHRPIQPRIPRLVDLAHTAPRAERISTAEAGAGSQLHVPEVARL
jgi:hypothetical protein